MAKRLSKSTRRKLGRVATDLTNLLKEEIKRQDLIDTGRMLRETAAKVKLERNGNFKISIISTDYYKYVDGNFKVTSNAFKGGKYNKILNRLNEIIGDEMVSRIEKPA